MSAVADRILATAHADEGLEEFEDLYELEWEPENKYVETLKEIKNHPILWGSSLNTFVELPSVRFVGQNANLVFTALPKAPEEGQLTWDKAIVIHSATTKPAESVQLEIAKCIAARPHESISLGSRLGIVMFVFTLLVYFVGGVLIINPVFAFFGILAFV